MLRLGLFCVLVGMVAAECGPLQIIRVKSQWAEAYGDGAHRDAFAQAVWRAIFKYTPESESLFDRVNGQDVTSPEFRAHALRVLDGLDMVISLLDDEPAFNAQLAHLKGQHNKRGIPANYFRTFGVALETVARAAIGKCFDQDAFESCYDKIASGIKS